MAIKGNDLYIAEIGDNGKKHKTKTILKFREPTVSSNCAKSDVEKTSFNPPSSVGTFNAESFFVDPSSGDMYVLTKARGSRGHTLKIKWNPGSTQTAEDLGKTNIDGEDREMTGADISPDGSMIAVRLYDHVLIYHRNGRSIGDTLKAEPKCKEYHKETQGEAIAFSADGKKVYTVSEGRNKPIWEFALGGGEGGAGGGGDGDVGGSSKGGEACPKRDGCASILVIGDFGDDKSGKQTKSAKGMAKIAEPDCTDVKAIHGIGDVIYPDGTKGKASKLDKGWTKKYLGHQSLNKPWYLIAGNHDWHGDATGMLDFAKKSKSNHKGYFNMPDFFYKTDLKSSTGVTVDVFNIDTMIWYESAPKKHSGEDRKREQINWLKDELRKSTASWKVVVGQHPVYSAGSHGV